MADTFRIQPIIVKERIKELDFLRGFAILGILIMNIQSFSMPEAAYLNPMAYGDLTGINKWVWIFSHIFGDMKFMTIFSILFGAGIYLFAQNAEKKTGKSAGLHYRRTFWLLLIGLVHAHLIWYGDILVPYAICAIFIFHLRNIRPGIQIAIGIVLISVHTLIYLGAGFSMPNWPPASVESVMESWNPDIKIIKEKIAAYTGSYSEQLTIRSQSATFMETTVLLMLLFWRVSGLMLIGMALYKWGILTAKRGFSFYTRGLLISWLIGLSIVIYGIYANFATEWSLEFSMFIGSQYNYWGSLFVSYGLICGIMLVAKSKIVQGLKDRLAAVGQMALTNYLIQSIICTFIFYGIGLSYFGKIERIGQILIVVGIWTLQLIWSQQWLNKFQFGPFEWLWRSVTYLKWQKFKKEY